MTEDNCVAVDGLRIPDSKVSLEDRLHKVGHPCVQHGSLVIREKPVKSLEMETFK